MENKRCTKCRETLLKSCFSKTSYGLNPRCIKCDNAICREYSRSKRGLLIKIYAHQSRASKKRGHNPPEYTREELGNWLMEHPLFDDLYANWVASEYNSAFTPSIDRLDNYKGYSFNNIQLMTWGENRSKNHRDVLNGLNNKKNYSIVQLNHNGEIIKEYHSIRQAKRETGRHSIDRYCNGTLEQPKDFIWVFKDYDKRLTAEISKEKRLRMDINKIGVIQSTLDGLVVNHFHSIAQANKKTGISKFTISRVCNGDGSEYQGYLWRLDN